MLSIDEIKQLIELIDESTLDEFELETKDSKILLKKHKTVVATAVQEAPIAVAPAQTAPVTPAAAPQVEASTAEDVNLEVITSPMVGTFMHPLHQKMLILLALALKYPRNPLYVL